MDHEVGVERALAGLLLPFRPPQETALSGRV